MIWPALAPIGLDIGSRRIKAAQMHGRRLAAAVSIPRAGGDGRLEASELQAVAAALRKAPFRGRSVVLAVPSDRLLTSILELPPRSSGAPLEQLARIELARRHAVEPESLEMACWDLPLPARAANRTCVMAVACRQDEADSLLDAVEAQGLNVQAMDVHAMAVTRACRPLLAEAGQSGAILDVGWSCSRLVLVHLGTVVYERHLPKYGLASLTRLEAPEGGQPEAPDPAGKLSPDATAHLEAMAGEVRVPLSYLTSQHPDAQVRQILLIGGGARRAGLGRVLASKLAMEVRPVEAGDLCEADGEAGDSMVVAMGLAQYSEGDA